MIDCGKANLRWGLFWSQVKSTMLMIRYRACQKSAPWKNIIITNICHQFCFKNTHYLVSPISSSSNASDSIKFEHPIPDIWSIYWHGCELQSDHFFSILMLVSEPSWWPLIAAVKGACYDHFLQHWLTSNLMRFLYHMKDRIFLINILKFDDLIRYNYGSTIKQRKFRISCNHRY